MSPHPDDQDGHAVHDQHHYRHHHNHNSINEQTDRGQVYIGLIEAFLFKTLHIEGSDDHHARKVLARHQVETVDQVLDDFEPGQGNREYGHDQAQQDDHR